MLVTVREYLKKSHEFICRVEDPQILRNSVIIVDPFVTCAWTDKEIFLPNKFTKL